ncbi:MAG TPA: phospholipase D-like domain-containing protein [Acidobacteriaceae bacterium]|nr:phospholipase D-like domain-containing protein [Acidobacteriaceae bacterium]
MICALLLAVTVPTWVAVLGVIALVLIAAYMLAGIFGPSPDYKIESGNELAANGSDAFLSLLQSLVDAPLSRTGTFEVLANGPSFYPAQFEAIRSARHSVNLEAYIFQRSGIGKLYLDALTDRARAGVRVNVVLDAFGSAGVSKRYFSPLLDSGGKVAFYNSPTWYRALLLDHRTHRELLIVDGRTGFIGGAGIADQWFKGVRNHPVWRDTMLRVEGGAVPSLQSTFAENWLAATGELLAGSAYFPGFDCQTSCPDPTHALVVNSTPTIGGSTRARVLFQLLLASAKQSISITTPYFLPDRSLSHELCRAIEERHVKVRILVPGRKSDHMLTRSTSRSAYGPLLKSGAEVYEYQPAMIHAKVLVVDRLWTVVGSTNFDNRSFGLNDEVNLAVRDASLAQRMESDLANDLVESCSVTLEEWRRRSLAERVPELLGWIFERQQ